MFMSSSLAHQLADQHLTTKSVTPFTKLATSSLYKAVSSFGTGIDHFNGEEVVALIDDDSVKEQFLLGVIVTTRRLLGRTNSKWQSMAYSDMKQVTKINNNFFTTPYVELGHLNGTDAVRFGMASVKPLGAFMQALLAVPLPGRVPSPIPLINATTQDPTGAAHALKNRVLADIRPKTLLHYLYRRYPPASQTDITVGKRLSGRVMLINQTLLHGRGMWDGWWLSSLSLNDLMSVLPAILGDVEKSEDVDGITRLHFDLGRNNKGKAKAALSSAIGLAALAGFGIGWVSTAGKSLRYIRIDVRDLGQVTGFQILTHMGAPIIKELSRTQAIGVNFFNAVSNTLLNLEMKTILLRSVLGTDPDLNSLWGISPQVLNVTMNHIMEHPVDLTPFYPPAKE